jgi:hypothetical protein
MKAIIADSGGAEEANPLLFVPRRGLDKVVCRKNTAFTNRLFVFVVPPAENRETGKVDKNFMIGGLFLPGAPNSAVRFNERDRWGKGLSRLDVTVQNRYLMSPVCEFSGQMTTDESCASGNENLHRLYLSSA